MFSGIEISATELKNWHDFTGIKFTSWEFEVLMSMKSAFIDQQRISSDLNCFDPLASYIEIQEERNLELRKQLKTFVKR